MMQRSKNSDKYFKDDNEDDNGNDDDNSDDDNSDDDNDAVGKSISSKRIVKSTSDIGRVSDDEDDGNDNPDSDSDIDDDDDINIEGNLEDEDDDAPQGLIQDFNALINDDSDDESDDEDDENYLQKIDDGFKKNIITEYHPELSIHNYDEVDVLSKVVRDETGNIIDPLHRTLPFITKYERARIIGERTQQLNAGAIAFVKVDPNIIDGYLIALKEFEAKKIPFIIKRPLPNGGVEYWKMSDLELL
jgi:DNA-directed RNA polymerase subunit K/omega